MVYLSDRLFLKVSLLAVTGEGGEDLENTEVS